MQTTSDKKILILGISDNKTRYSYLAYEKLLSHGFNNLIGVTNKEIELPTIQIFSSLDKISAPVHTVTLYVNGETVNSLFDKIIALKPERIIFNPGTENEDSIQRAKSLGIEVVIGCTLVMLASNQF